MCHDLSFTAATVDFITDLIPDVLIDGQLEIDFCNTSHVLSMANSKCLCLYNDNGQTHLKSFEWGLVADFMRTPELIKKYRLQMANARMENVFEKRSAWHRVKDNRCLIAVQGVYEHRQVTGFKNKIPYFIKLKDNHHLLLPGFYNYSPMADKETGEMTGTFSVITRPANALMRQIHNQGTNKHRMPVFMQPKMALQWILPGNIESKLQDLLQYEITDNELEAWPVYSVRSRVPRPDDKEKFAPFPYDKLPALGMDELPPLQQSLF